MYDIESILEMYEDDYNPSSKVPGPRNMYADGLTVKQQQKVVEAFPNTQFDFKEYPKYGVKKYLTNKVGPVDDRKTNKEYTKVDRFKKKGFTLEMGKGKNTRGEEYSKEGKRLSIKDQNKIKATFELPEGVKEWDFKTHKYGIKQEGRENLLKRMAKKVGDKNPWTLAADFGSAKGWMLAQMERVYKNESKNPNIKKLTYKPIYEKINGIDRIIGFKDNTIAGKGKTYYGLNKYTKKNAGDWTKHGDYKQNLKLIDISKRSGNAPNEVIMGLLKDRNFKGNNVKLNHLIHFLSGTKETSQEILKNAIVRHHNSGVAFGNATDDLSLTTQTINKKITGIEERIRANKILPDDIQTLKNNNVYVRHQGKLYGSGSKTAIGQFKQIESDVARSLKSGVDFKGKKFETKQLLSYLEKLGCGKAAGGRILFSEGTPGASLTKCGKKGVARFIDDLKKGNYSKASLNILKGGGNLIKNIANPMELLKLRNLIGPGAMGLMAAFEAGVITDDVIRQGTPLNESLANNWLTKTFLPYTQEYAKAKNLLETGKVPSNMKKYVQDVVTFNDMLIDMKGIKGRKDSRLVDQGGYGMGDGSSMYTKEQEQKDDAALMKKAKTLTENVFTPGTGKALEMKALQNESEATRMAKKEFSPIFGFDKLKDVRTPGSTSFDYIPDEQPVDLRPITYKDYEKKELPAAERQYYENKYNIKPRSSLSEYYLPGAKVNVLDELTSKYNMREAAKYPGFFSADSEKFSKGGITELRSKYEYKK